MKNTTTAKTLVIAEKPSVAQDIVKALTPVAGKFEKHEDHFESETYVVTSAVGHLVEIQAPEEFDVKRGKWSFANLPVIPPHFGLKPVDKTKSRLNAVVKQAKRKDVGALINACDAGREGELIFRLIEQYAGGAKPLGKPVKRLWLQSMTPQAIRDGFDSLRSAAQMQGLADAARTARTSTRAVEELRPAVAHSLQRMDRSFDALAVMAASTTTASEQVSAAASAASASLQQLQGESLPELNALMAELRTLSVSVSLRQLSQQTTTAPASGWPLAPRTWPSSQQGWPLA
jgi:hypothetical protein